MSPVQREFCICKPAWSEPMKVVFCLLISSVLLVACDNSEIGNLHGSTYVSPDIIQSRDPSSFQFLNHTGSGMRQVFDRRVDSYINLEMILFQARFQDGPGMEIQVNPEFGSAANAEVYAQTYANAVGQLPLALRKNMKRIIIHRGHYLFGGGYDHLLVHTEMGAEYISQGILEETILHEAAHTALDPDHKDNKLWQHAQQTDGQFITNYARDFPRREDIAESFVLYVGARHQSERLPPELTEYIQATIPNRMAYFDKLNISPLSWSDITGIGAESGK
jgi:hypothetical protein